MKIGVYFIKNYMIPILIIIVMYGAFGYVFIMTKQYLGILALVFIAVLLLNRRIILYKDKVIVIQGYKKIEIEFSTLESLKIADYRPKFSHVGMPAIYAILKDSKQKIFYYSSYSRESIIEIINYAITKNSMIKLDLNTKELISHKESKYDIKKRKDEKQTLILMVVAIIITIIYAKFK
jgi:hypothetical protein